MMKRYGFTLAEVLITLGIIGVVAAMTIPSLMNQTGGAEYKAGFKKAVSVLNQAITMNVAIDGNDFSSLDSGATANSATIYNMLSQRMNVASTSPDAAFGAIPAGSGTNYTLFFTDGMAVSFPNGTKNCTTAGQTGCRMVIDVNGEKRPNTLSLATNETTKSQIHDQFVVDFFNQQVQPHNDAARYIMYN